MDKLMTCTALASLLLGMGAGCTGAVDSGLARVLPDLDKVVIDHPGTSDSDTSSAKAVAEAPPEDEKDGGCQEKTSHISHRANEEIQRTMNMLEHLTAQEAEGMEGDAYVYMPPDPEDIPEECKDQGPPSEDSTPIPGCPPPPHGGGQGGQGGGQGGPPPQDEDAPTPSEGEAGGPPPGAGGPPHGPPPVPNRLLVTPQDDGGYTYVLQWAAEGTEDWVDFITGQVTAGSTREAGSGAFVVDFDAVVGLDPDPEHQHTGKASYTYTFAEDGSRAIEATLSALTDPDGEVFDAALTFDRLADGSASLDAWRLDEASREVVDAARWDTTRAGRCDSRATGGDLGTSLGEMTQCWDDTRALVYSVQSLDGEVEATSGDAALCVFSDSAL